MEEGLIFQTEKCVKRLSIMYQNKKNKYKRPKD
jgi:hypothetical protein